MCVWGGDILSEVNLIQFEQVTIHASWVENLPTDSCNSFCMTYSNQKDNIRYFRSNTKDPGPLSLYRQQSSRLRTLISHTKYANHQNIWLREWSIIQKNVATRTPLDLVSFFTPCNHKKYAQMNCFVSDDVVIWDATSPYFVLVQWSCFPNPDQCRQLFLFLFLFNNRGALNARKGV